MFTKRLSWGIGILCVAILLCLLFMAVNGAQTAARRMQSSNNLKQIILAYHNFESAMKRLPPGCDEVAKHGWPTHIFNYMEASTWYNEVDKQVGWEHPFNFYKFRTRMSSYQNPGIVSSYTSEGYALTHYLANENFFYRGSKTKLGDIDAGLSNVWFVGEIDSKYPPFGYPYNWRALRWPLNSKDGGFGAWHYGAQFAFGDGVIRFVSSSVDRSVVEQMANSTALPDSDRTRIPDRSFQCGGVEFARTSVAFENEQEERVKGGSYSMVYFDKEKQPEVIVYRGRPGLKKLGIDPDTLLAKYSEAPVVDYGSILDSRAAESIEICKRLEALKVGMMTDTALTIEKLKSLPKLKYLRGNFEADLLEQLRAALPECEVSSTEYSMAK